jgi:hypothetical protein
VTNTTGIDAYNRNELDRDIMMFVRLSAIAAPVTAEAVTGFIQNIRHRRVTDGEIADRLQYLEGADYLKRHVEWQMGGEFVHYKVTADGVDVLDGVKPPRNWQGK